MPLVYYKSVGADEAFTPPPKEDWGIREGMLATETRGKGLKEQVASAVEDFREYAAGRTAPGMLHHGRAFVITRIEL